MTQKELFILEIANFYIDNKCTVRDAAAHFEISKSAVHNYLQKRLPKISSSLAEQVRVISNKNFFEKHLRGGLATKQKYSKNLNKTLE